MQLIPKMIFTIIHLDGTNVSNFALAVIILLIVMPFVTSRIVLFGKPIVSLIEKYRSYISSASIFIIVFYLLTLVASKLIFDLVSVYERAAFWHSVTRYITLVLINSTFTTNTFGVSILLPIMLAYLIQIPFAILIDKKLIVKE